MSDAQSHTDSDVARAAIAALTWAVGVPEDRITVSVHGMELAPPSQRRG